MYMRKIIFVCHGNICRSVAAEYIFKQLARKYQKDGEFMVISRATSREEIGNDIYPPMKRALSHHNIEFGSHHAKQITQEDYDWADEIYYMDEMNRRYLDTLVVNSRHIIYPISKYTPEISSIEDPWYSGEYDIVINEISQCVNDIINHKE